MVLVDSQVQQLDDAMAGFTPPAAGQLSLSPALCEELSDVF